MKESRTIARADRKAATAQKGAAKATRNAEAVRARREGGGAGADTPPSPSPVADSVAFVAVDTDLSSAQWTAVDGLLSTFPGRDALVTRLRQGFERRAKVSWADAPSRRCSFPAVACGASPGRRSSR